MPLSADNKKVQIRRWGFLHRTDPINMFRTTVCLISFLALANGNSLMLSRIVGGKDAENEDYPYQASLRVRGVYWCGATILNEYWLLTAAHCVYKKDQDSMIVVVGSESILYGGKAYRVERVKMHPMYIKGLKKHDIALLRVDRNFIFSKDVKPIKLPTENVDEKNCTGIFTGWGSISSETGVSYVLQEIQLKVYPLELCRKTFPTVMSTNLCTYTEAGEGLCYGDSGSPLVYNGVQIAIGSWGSPCARGYPDIHTRVFPYVDWIKSVIDE